MKLLRKAMEGFAFGVGLSIAMGVIYSIYVWWAWPAMVEQTLSNSATVGRIDVGDSQLVSAAPGLTSSTYLGSSSIYSDRFQMGDYGVLAPGPGKIAGEIVRGKQPVQGLRVRLGLNSSVMTQWAESDAQGRYEISVPVGDYRVDAFEVDTSTANRQLPGKIERPGNLILDHTFSVTAESVATGPRFEFVDPVRKLAPSGTVTYGDNIVIAWQPYLDATEYAVDLYKIPNPGDYSSVESLFPFRERPRVAEARLSLAEIGLSLEPGIGYRYSITAYEGRRVLSETHDEYATADFIVSE